MSTAPAAKAIILRGPPAVGKSTVRDLILAHVGAAGRYINLDAHWGIGEWRYADSAFRYADLHLATEPVLVMELAWGEPPDFSFPGATRGANEWVDVLRQAGRQIYAFLLTADWHEIVTRLIARHGHPLAAMNQIGRASFYEHHHHYFMYPVIAGFTEQTIDTTGRSEQEVADEVRKAAGL